jgi:hypothetical protein
MRMKGEFLGLTIYQLLLFVALFVVIIILIIFVTGTALPGIADFVHSMFGGGLAGGGGGGGFG